MLVKKEIKTNLYMHITTKACCTDEHLPRNNFFMIFCNIQNNCSSPYRRLDMFFG